MSHEHDESLSEVTDAFDTGIQLVENLIDCQSTLDLDSANAYVQHIDQLEKITKQTHFRLPKTINATSANKIDQLISREHFKGQWRKLVKCKTPLDARELIKKGIKRQKTLALYGLVASRLSYLIEYSVIRHYTERAATAQGLEMSLQDETAVLAATGVKIGATIGLSGLLEDALLGLGASYFSASIVAPVIANDVIGLVLGNPSGALSDEYDALREKLAKTITLDRLAHGQILSLKKNFSKSINERVEGSSHDRHLFSNVTLVQKAAQYINQKIDQKHCFQQLFTHDYKNPYSGTTTTMFRRPVYLNKTSPAASSSENSRLRGISFHLAVEGGQLQGGLSIDLAQQPQAAGIIGGLYLCGSIIKWVRTPVDTKNTIRLHDSVRHIKEVIDNKIWSHNLLLRFFYSRSELINRHVGILNGQLDIFKAKTQEYPERYFVANVMHYLANSGRYEELYQLLNSDSQIQQKIFRDYHQSLKKHVLSLTDLMDSGEYQKVKRECEKISSLFPQEAALAGISAAANLRSHQLINSDTAFKEAITLARAKLRSACKLEKPEPICPVTTPLSFAAREELKELHEFIYQQHQLAYDKHTGKKKTNILHQWQRYALVSANYFPYDSQYRVRLGDLSCLEKSWETAASHYQKALTMQNCDIGVFYKLGVSQLNLCHCEQGITYLERFQREVVRTGRYSESEELFNSQLILKEQYFTEFQQNEDPSYLNKALEQAKMLYGHGLSSFSLKSDMVNFVRDYVSAAEALTLMKDLFNQVVVSASQPNVISQQDFRYYMYQLGDLFYANQQYQDANEQYCAALVGDTQNPNALLRYAASKNGLGHLQDSYTILSYARTLEPNNIILNESYKKIRNRFYASQAFDFAKQCASSLVFRVADTYAEHVLKDENKEYHLLARSMAFGYKVTRHIKAIPKLQQCQKGSANTLMRSIDRSIMKSIREKSGMNQLVPHRVGPRSSLLSAKSLQSLQIISTASSCCLMYDQLFDKNILDAEDRVFLNGVVVTEGLIRNGHGLFYGDMFSNNVVGGWVDSGYRLECATFLCAQAFQGLDLLYQWREGRAIENTIFHMGKTFVEGAALVSSIMVQGGILTALANVGGAVTLTVGKTTVTVPEPTVVAMTACTAGLAYSYWEYQNYQRNAIAYNAQCCLNDGDYKQALVKISHCLEQKPYNNKYQQLRNTIYLAQADAYAKKNKTDKAISTFYHYLQYKPTDESAREAVRTLISIDCQQKAKAGEGIASLASYHCYLKKFPDDEKAHDSLSKLRCVLLIGDQRYQEAVEACNERLKFNANEPHALRHRARAYAAMGKFHNAKNDLSIILARDATDADALLQRSMLDLRRGYLSSARRDAKLGLSALQHLEQSDEKVISQYKAYINSLDQQIYQVIAQSIAKVVATAVNVGIQQAFRQRRASIPRVSQIHLSFFPRAETTAQQASSVVKKHYMGSALSKSLQSAQSIQQATTFKF